MANQKKQLRVQTILELLKINPNFVLVKFEKTPHRTLEELRKELKKNQSHLKVVKNTLFEKAINKLSKTFNVLAELRKKSFPLKENSALITFKSDYIGPLSVFYKFAQNEKNLSFKLGFLDNQIYLNQDLLKIAQLPPKDQLIAKIVQSIKTPLTRFIYSIKFSQNKFVYILKERLKVTN